MEFTFDGEGYDAIKEFLNGSTSMIDMSQPYFYEAGQEVADASIEGAEYTLNSYYQQLGSTEIEGPTITPVVDWDVANAQLEQGMDQIYDTYGAKVLNIPYEGPDDWFLAKSASELDGYRVTKQTDDWFLQTAQDNINGINQNEIPSQASQSMEIRELRDEVEYIGGMWIREIEETNDAIDRLTDASNKAGIYIDGKTLVGYQVTPMDKELGRRQALAERGI